MGDEHNRRSPLDRLTDLVPVDAVMRNVDVQALLDRIDMDALLERIDVNAVVAKVDLDEVVSRMDLGAIVQRSVRGVTSGSIDEVRTVGERLDAWITHHVDRLLRRAPGWRSAAPSATVTSDTE